LAGYTGKADGLFCYRIRYNALRENHQHPMRCWGADVRTCWSDKVTMWILACFPTAWERQVYRSTHNFRRKKRGRGAPMCVLRYVS
jgi:hypothetical protein